MGLRSPPTSLEFSVDFREDPNVLVVFSRIHRVVIVKKREADRKLHLPVVRRQRLRRRLDGDDDTGWLDGQMRLESVVLMLMWHGSASSAIGSRRDLEL